MDLVFLWDGKGVIVLCASEIILRDCSNFRRCI